MMAPAAHRAVAPLDDDLPDAPPATAMDTADVEAAMARLAALPPIEYDRLREAEAKRLGIRMQTLDKGVAKRRPKASSVEQGGGLELSDPEPWPHSVHGAELLVEITDVINKHLVLPPGAADAIALWIIHAHAHDSARISPILAVTSPTPECGKTTLLTLLGALVPRPIPASNITPASLFRAVEKWRPTLLVDEADTFLADSDELRGVINSGHNKASAFVIRTVGDEHEPAVFSTWAPKAIAMIGRLAPTLESRAVHIELRRLAVGEAVEPLRGDRRFEHLEVLRRKAYRWGQDNTMALSSAEPEMPAAMRGRTADNWRHLLAIADLAGGDWPSRARKAAEVLSAGRRELSAGAMLLEDLKTLFDSRKEDRLASADIIAVLTTMEERPWQEWKNGRQLTASQLAKLLAPFKIAPKTIRFGSGPETAKGYLRDQFDDVFRRYLPPQSVTPSQASNSATSAMSDPSQTPRDVTDHLSQKPAENLNCDVVTDQNPGWEGEV